MIKQEHINKVINFTLNSEAEMFNASPSTVLKVMLKDFQLDGEKYP